MSKLWEWAGQVGHSWRTSVLADDLEQAVGRVQGERLPLVRPVEQKTGDTNGKLQARLAPHSVLLLHLSGPAKP